MKKNIEKVSVEQVAERSGIEPRLIRAVVRQLGGRESLEYVANHGASCGYSGFIYYSDTVAFYKRNRAAIVKLAQNQASDLGESVIPMIAGFNCLRGDKGAELENEIGRILYGRVGSDEMNVANALAWFALEEVARAFQNVCEE